MNERGAAWLLALLAVIVIAIVLAVIFVYAGIYFWPSVVVTIGLLVLAVRNVYGYVIGGLLIAAGIVLLVLTGLGILVIPAALAITRIDGNIRAN